MNNIVMLFILISSFLFSGCLYADKVGSGDSNDDVNDDDDNGDCDDNHAPELLRLYYFLKVDEGWIPLEPPVSIASSDFESFYIRLEYSDDDCNLFGGKFWLKFEDGDWEYIEDLPDDLGCSTNETGKLYPLKLKDAVGELLGGEYEGQIKWTDACNDESNTLDFSFSLY